MFNNAIQKSPLVSGQAEEVLGRITGNAFLGDVSFLSTLRALVFRRMPEGDRIYFSVSRSNYSKADAERYSKRDLADNIASKNNRISTTGGFALHYFDNADKIANERSMDAIVSKFEEVRSGYKRLDHITAFYKGVSKNSKNPLNVVCFINEDIKAVALFIEQMDYRRYHFLQAPIPAMMPWYFGPRPVKLEPVEMEILASLSDKTKNENDYLTAIRKVYDTFDFRSELIRKMLAGFETQFLRDALSSERSKYKDKIRQIRELNTRIGDFLAQQNEISIRIAGMEKKIEEGGDDSELMDYFLGSKNLTLTGVEGSKVDFIVRSTLEYYDPDVAEAAVNNSNSRLYTRCSGIANREDLKRFWTAVFVDQKLKINVCAKFNLRLNGGVGTNGGYGDGFDAEFSDCMPHPHIEYFDCMGGYVQIINELMANHDYIMAIEQCVASCSSLNFNDGTVLSKFCDVMSGEAHGNNRCILMPDGTVVTPVEAIEWLKAQECETE